MNTLQNNNKLIEIKSYDNISSTDNPSNFFSKNIVLHKEIGEGLFSHIFLGILSVPQKNIDARFAVKISDKDNTLKFFMDEVKALHLLKASPFIVNMFASYILEDIPHILLELGNISLDKLYYRMLENNLSITDGNLSLILDNLSRAAEAMIELKIDYFDLHCGNILYFFNQGVFKVIDFNQAKFDVSNEKNRTIKAVGCLLSLLKLRFDHKCIQQQIYLCDTCRETSTLDFIENTIWKDANLSLILKKIITTSEGKQIDPKEIYDNLNLIEPLPRLV
jgi:serine/threonine protein kinase